MDEENKSLNLLDKKYIIYYVIGAVLLFAVLYGINQNGFKRNYQAGINTNYHASLNKAVTYVSDVEMDLKKARITEDTASAVVLYASAWNNAQNAHEHIASLPYSQDMVSDVLEYLHETAELSYSLMEKSAKGENPSVNEQARLKEIQKKGAVISSELKSLASQINLSEHAVVWESLGSETTDTFEAEGGYRTQALLGSMIHVKNQLSDYSSQSTGESDEAPALLKNSYLMGANEGAAMVRSLLRSYGVKEVNFVGSTDVTAENAVAVYTYEVITTGSDKTEFTVDITQDGGYPVMMIKHTRDYTGSNFMSVDKAIRLADKFLSESGYENMTALYHEIHDSMVYISYYPVINDIIYYSDEIKVKVNLSDGDILGFWAGEYIYNHSERFLESVITSETAQGKLKEDFAVSSVRGAVIKSAGEEVLCYEFEGTFENEQYKVFINSVNGTHEKTELVYNNVKGLYVR